MSRRLLSVLFQPNQGIRYFRTTICNREIFKVQSIDEFNQKVLKSESPVIVDFFATWCNPCKMLTPRIESVVSEKKLTLAKVDIDEHSELALDYEVSSVPVLLIMENGKVTQRLVGLQDVDKLKTWIDSAIKNKK